MSRLRHLRRGVAAGVLLLAGCATHIPQALNPQLVPAAFVGQDSGRDPVWPKPDWWQQFASPELSEFMGRAQGENRDLAVAAARVIEAQAQTTIQRAALFPQLNLQAQGQRTGTRGAQSSALTNSPIGNSFGLSLGASYEVDVWGLARSNLRAATETLKATQFARQAVALSVTANVANAYFSVLALRKRIAIANEDMLAIRDILKTIELRVSAGKSSHLDLAQERAQVESVEAELPQLEEKIGKAWMATRTVYFEERALAVGDRGAAEGVTSGLVTAFDGDGVAPTLREIVPIEILPTNLPVEFTVSPARIITPGVGPGK